MTRPALLIPVLAVSAAVIAATVLAATLTRHLDPGTIADDRGLDLVVCAVLATVLANGLVLRRRLAPLEQLTTAMERVDFSTRADRVAPPRGGAEEVERLRQAFHRMLDRIEAERARSAGAVLNLQEAERARLARDLHDEADRTLTGVVRRLDGLAERAPGVLRAELRETRGVAAQAVEELLGLALELRPAALDDLGPAAALAELTADVGRRVGLDARVHLEPEALDALGEDGRIVAYHIVQEALSNVARHAAARRVCVSAVLEDGWTVVRVDDDGRGFDERTAACGVGFTGMRERAGLAGGSLRVRPVPGEGTLVEVRLPPARGGRIERP